MSVYQNNKLLYLTDNDPAFRKRMKEEPENVLSEFKLTPEEHAALTSGALGKLYQMGVHTFLLNHLYRYELFGVNRDNYLSRIREGHTLIGVCGTKSPGPAARPPLTKGALGICLRCCRTQLIFGHCVYQFDTRITV